MESEKRWYVIHTYSGYENKVKANLERKVHSLGMENEVFNIVIPMENEIEVKDGKKRSVQRKVFPGYVLVEMIVNDRSWCCLSLVLYSANIIQKAPRTSPTATVNGEKR